MHAQGPDSAYPPIGEATVSDRPTGMWTPGPRKETEMFNFTPGNDPFAQQASSRT